MNVALPSVLEAPSWNGETASSGARWRTATPSDHLRLTAARQPHKEGVRFQGTSLSWGEIDAMANRAASGFLALGARPGSIVGVLADNTPETLALVYGASRAGITFVPFNARLTKAEIEWQLADVKADNFVSNTGDGWTVSQVLNAGTEKDPGVDVDPMGYFWIRFTSGTTGKPKAVATTQIAAAALFEGLAREIDYTPEDVGLVNAPLAHAAIGPAAAHLYLGATLVIEPGFDKDKVWLTCDEQQISHVLMVPTMFAMALDAPGTGDSLKGLFSMGSVFPPELRKRVNARFPKARLYDAYGGTEFGACTVLRPEEAVTRPSSVGLPRFGAQVRVLDPEGNEVPSGEIGQIYVQGPTLCRAWVGSVPPSPGTIRGEWVSAGDLGWRDDEGFLFIADRRDDLIISGGFNVYPREVETVLEGVAGVREVAVVGVPHPEWGQQVVAYVTGTVSQDDLDAAARKELAGYKVPRRYEFVEDLPRNASGKLLRRVLRENG